MEARWQRPSHDDDIDDDDDDDNDDDIDDDVNSGADKTDVWSLIYTQKKSP